MSQSPLVFYLYDKDGKEVPSSVLLNYIDKARREAEKGAPLQPLPLLISPNGRNKRLALFFHHTEGMPIWTGNISSPEPPILISCAPKDLCKREPHLCPLHINKEVDTIEISAHSPLSIYVTPISHDPVEFVFERAMRMIEVIRHMATSPSRESIATEKGGTARGS